MASEFIVSDRAVPESDELGLSESRGKTAIEADVACVGDEFFASR